MEPHSLSSYSQIATYGYVFFPNTPSTNTSMVFSSEERELAVDRLPPRAETKLDRTIFRRVLGSWRWWLLCLIWIVGGELESIGASCLALTLLPSAPSDLALASRIQWPHGSLA